MGATAIESLPPDGAVVHVGPGSFVMPWREFRANPSQLARLQLAAMLSDNDDMALVRDRLLGEIEAEMAREHRRRQKIPEGRAIRAPADLEIGEGPLALVPARRLHLPVIHTDEGRVYSPEPMRSRPRTEAEEDHDPLADERARLDHASMTDSQAWRLATADFYVERANRLREARPKGARISDDERGSQNTARRILIQLRREVLQNGDTEATRARILNAEHLADQEGRASRRKAMQIRRTELIAADVSHWERVRQLWAYRKALRTVKTSRNVDGLTLLALNPIQKAAAYEYRGLYQRTERGARVAQMGAVVVGGEDKRKAEEWGADQIARKRVEAKVMAHFKGNGRGITTLRLVAGEGRTINAISGGKSQNRKLNAGALAVALDIVADHLGMQ